MQIVEVTPKTSLPDICAEALAYAVQLRRAAEPAADALRAHVRRLFAEIDQAGQVAGKDFATVKTARYALAALLDEVVLGSNWSIRSEWAGNPLQLEHFNDTTAGEEFYRKLDTLLASNDPRHLEALEVYGLCLGMGFRGGHAGIAGLEAIKGLRARIHERIAGGPAPQPLSPHWEVEEHLPQMVRRLSPWLVAAVAAGALLLFVLVLHLMVNSSAGALSNAIQENR